MQAIDTAVAAGVWMEAVLSSKGSPVHRALEALSENPRTNERFFPELGHGPSDNAFAFVENLDPFDPLDVGVLMGLNAWLRSTLSVNPDDYRSFETLVIDDARRESPIVLVLALPLAAKGIGVAAAGAYGVLKAVDKYFSIKKTKAQTKRISAATEHDARLAEAKRRRIEAGTRKLEAEADAVRARVADLEGLGRKGIAADLETQVPNASDDQIAKAASIGAKTSSVVIHELEQKKPRST